MHKITMIIASAKGASRSDGFPKERVSFLDRIE